MVCMPAYLRSYKNDNNRNVDTTAGFYSLCKSIRLEFLVNIFGYIHDITIPTKNLCLGINYLHFLFLALNDPVVTYLGTQMCCMGYKLLTVC